MKTRDYKASAVSSGLGSFLMIVTMVLHPLGDDIAGIQAISLIAIISHSIAISSVPFTYLGFKGFTRYLDSPWYFSQAGMSFFVFSSVTVISAAAINGLAVPFFVEGLDANDPNVDTAYWILRYSFRLNRAYDYIFMGFACGAVLCWSIAILKSKRLPSGLGVFGLIIGAIGLGLVLFGRDLARLAEFRLFVFGYVAWIVWAGVALYRGAAKHTVDEG